MNIKRSEILEAIASQAGEIADAIERALRAAGKCHRKASVVVTFTAKHDKDSPHVLVLSSVLKVKEPKGARIDVTGTTESVELMRLDTGEENGQRKIGDGE